VSAGKDNNMDIGRYLTGWISHFRSTPGNIFLSHASQDKGTAESIAFSLRSRGYPVFLDRDDLPAGDSFDRQIERAVEASEIFIFLVSPDSVKEGHYTLTELAFARSKWKTPEGHVLPVMVCKTPLEQVPSYLKAVTILEPLGNITAETSAAAAKLISKIQPPTKLPIAIIFVVVVAVLSAVIIWRITDSRPPTPTPTDLQECMDLPHPKGTGVWIVDKSCVYLDTTEGKRQFFLMKPNSDLLAKGARPGSQLFIGERSGESYKGKLFVFAGGRCQPLQYDATGLISNNDETVTLTGKAPQIDTESCTLTGEQERTLVFRFKGR
jgi:hypothetical protein